MKRQKANKIRGKLLNLINNEILTNFKRKDLIRINGFNLKELYNYNCENYEVCIINQIIRNDNINNQSCKSKNYSNLHLDIIPIDLLEKFEGEKSSKKKLLSKSKIKQFETPKNVEMNNINNLIIERNKLKKKGLIIMRKILNNIKNRRNESTTKTLKTPRNTIHHSFRNIITKKRNYGHKSSKLLFNENEEFKIELIKMKYSNETNLIENKKDSSKKISNFKKEKHFQNYQNQHPIFTDYINKNINEDKKIKYKREFSFRNLHFKNNVIENDYRPKTNRNKVITLTLKDDSL